jgi:photosystem II stability/assembly factor-like uncharacterized protein
MTRRIGGLLLIAALGGAAAASGAVNQWEPVGPYGHGGSVTAVAVAPSDSSVVFAGTPFGVFRSADAGVSWESRSAGLASLYVTALAVDPGTPSTAYVVMYANGLYKTTNSGVTWTQLLSIAPEVPNGSITVDPTDPRVLYFGSQGQIRKSTDGGASWTASDELFGGAPVASIAVDPTDHATVYAAAGPVYKSLDGGSHWLATGLVSAGAVRIAPSDPSTVYAVTLEGIFVSHDGAQTWAAGGAINGSPADLAVDPHSAGTVFVTGIDGVSKSTDGGVSWQVVDAGLPDASDRCMYAITTAPDGTLYAGNICPPGGLFKSSDRAASWTETGGAFTPVDVRAITASSASSAIYAATDAGVFRTLDRGATWTPLNGGLSNLDVKEVVSDPSNSSTLYARTATVVAKSVDGGAFWSDLRFGPVSALALSVSAQSPSSLYAATDDGRLWRSTDGGSNWLTSTPFPPHAILSIAVDPINPSIVFAGTSFAFNVTGAIYRSADAGATWTQLFSGINSEIDPEAFDRIVFDPRDSDTIYATWFDEGVPSQPAGLAGVYKSTDGGETWTGILNDNGPPGRPFAIDPQRTSTIYAGLQRSLDGGGTFQALTRNGLPPSLSSIDSLAISPSDASTVYAAAVGQGPMPLGIYRATFVTCSTDDSALCLGGGRFKVEVDWQGSPSDPMQKAHAVGASSLSGYFWFTDPYSAEIVVKILDGRSVNDLFWVFYGALTNRGYTITVTDRETGAVRTYVNEPGHVGSRADTSAFAGTGTGAAMDEADLASTLSVRPKAATGACVADAITLCLNGGRFLVGVGVPTSPSGPVLAAPAVPLTPDSGAFAFHDLGNLEVGVKILDGRVVNGHFWVFVGGLSDRAFEVDVIDTETGALWTYDNPAGVVQSHADTAAF